MKVLFVSLFLHFASSLNIPFQCSSQNNTQKGPCIEPPSIGNAYSWPEEGTTSNFTGKLAVRIGLLTTGNTSNCPGAELRFNHWFMYKRVQAAIQLAFIRVNDVNFLGKYNRYLQYYWIDDNCHDGRSVLIAAKLISEKRVAALIGPTMNTQVGPVSRHASYHNIPLITAGGLNEHFDDKAQEDYRTVIRMQDGYQELGNFMREFFNSLRWTKVTRNSVDSQNMLVYESWEKLDAGKARTESLFMCGALDIQLNRRVSGPTYKSEGVRFSKEKVNDIASYDSLLANIKKNARVVILCAEPDTVRNLMLQALRNNFLNDNEYVFINIDLFASQKETEKPWYREGAKDNEEARRAYRSVLTVTLRKPNSTQYRTFSEQVKQRTSQLHPDFQYNETEVNSFVGAFYDSVILYATALQETIEANGSEYDGRNVTLRMWNRTIEGITGNLSIDDNGDRNADYSLLDMNPATGVFEIVGNYWGKDKKFDMVPGKMIDWPGPVPPKDIPPCGFDGSKCTDRQVTYLIILIISLLVLLVLVTAASLLFYRHFKLKAELQSLTWKIRWEELRERQFRRGADRSMRLASTPNCTTNAEGEENTDGIEMKALGKNKNKAAVPPDRAETQSLASVGSEAPQMFTTLRWYKGNWVAIKPIYKPKLEVNRALLLEIKKMKDFNHNNTVRFIGICIDSPQNMYLVNEYYPRGSLQDILEDEALHLDWMLKFSFMQDIVKGMIYLQASLGPHGNLKSSNCVVDRRFVLKIGDFGLRLLRVPDPSIAAGSDKDMERRLWTAPELLRQNTYPPEGTLKADVYSFGIVCQEIIFREGVFYIRGAEELSAEVKVLKVKRGPGVDSSEAGELGLGPFRPSLDADDEALSLDGMDEETKEMQGETIEQRDLIALFELTQRCWAEDPIARPSFSTIKAELKRINPTSSGNADVMDNMLSRMEQYADNLELQVAKRTGEYLAEKKKAEDLLYLMLPKSIASLLMRGDAVRAESFESVTIYFSDICGFTTISATSTPMEVVALLNDLYSMFDETIEHFDVYKVETIGDAYMVVSGLPQRNENLHAREIARMSLTLLENVKFFKIRHKPDEQLKLRIGLHSGPVCAGVVGQKMPRYCLFGDTVNTASRMESNGMPLRIHASTATKDILDTYGSFKFEFRGQIDVKGKGAMKTWWLVGEDKSKAVPSTYEGFQSEHKHVQGNILSLKSSGSNTANLADKEAALEALALSKEQQQQQQQQQLPQQQQEQQQLLQHRQSTPTNSITAASKTANGGRRQRGRRKKSSSAANNLHNSSAAPGAGVEIDIEGGGIESHSGRDRPFKSMGADQAPRSAHFIDDGESGESSNSSRKQSSQLAPDSSAIFFTTQASAPSLSGSATANISRNASDTSETSPKQALIRRQSEDPAKLAVADRLESADFVADSKPAKKKKTTFVAFADDVPAVDADSSPSSSPAAATPLLGSAPDFPSANNSSSSNSKPARTSKAVSFLA